MIKFGLNNTVQYCRFHLVFQSVLDFLSSVGHEVSSRGHSGVVSPVAAEAGVVFAVADKRKAGGIGGF